jgi:hypothetical protein
MRKIIVFSAALTLSVLLTPLFAQIEDFDNILFLHHSTGYNLIAHGNVRGLIEEYNIQHGVNLQFWDHDYNSPGLRDPEGNYGYGSYDIPDDNTNPDGLYNIFMQPLHSPPDNAFSRIMLSHMLGGDTVTHEVFIFKSCFPASDINSEQMLTDYQNWYLAMRDVMDDHPEKIFIPFTPPPLVRSATTPENAARARRFADWLSSDTYMAGHPNAFTFNFWGLLAEHDSTSIYFNCLREEYGGDGGDSHPNDLANATIGPIFVDQITNSIESYTSQPPPPSSGDLDCNGIPCEAADAAVALSILQDRQGVTIDSCVRANGDIDDDDLCFSLGDICHLFNAVDSISLPLIVPDAAHDSIITSSAMARPGDTVALQITVSVADSILGFQAALKMNSSYFEMLEFIPNPMYQQYLFANLSADTFSIDCVLNTPTFNYLPPGRYLAGTLNVAISSDTPDETIGNLDYFNDSLSAIYTGISIFSGPPLYCQNPVLINGQVNVAAEFYPGDVNGDYSINGLDVSYLVNYFKGGPLIPEPVLRADANGSCVVNGMDVVYLVNFFKGGSPPFRGDCD